MSTLDERMALLDHYNDATPWQNAVHVLLTAIVERLEPADTQRTVVEVGEYAKACEERERLRAELGSTKTTSDQRFWLLDKKQRELDQAQDEAIALRAQVEALTKERDDWLAKCEREWARAYPASWQNKWADRLIAAAKERVDLRAQVAALTKQRDERLEEVAALRLDLANVRAAIDRDW